jgi:hypothetical protein
MYVCIRRTNRGHKEDKVNKEEVVDKRKKERKKEEWM